MRPYRRLIMPALAFAAVVGVHLVWLSAFPAQDPAQARWESVTGDDSFWASWVGRYLEKQSYWQGYAYGISGAFACVALRRFREKRLFGAEKAALGGLTLSGIAAAAGCFLSGCCGSPMLGVYLSLFGASFLPWAKPLVAGLTTATIGASYWWMVRRERMCCAPACCHGVCGKVGGVEGTTAGNCSSTTSRCS